MLTLYHGSNIYIDKIDLSKGLKDKDFGQGFYLTDIRDQAFAMAERKARMEAIENPRSKYTRPIITSFYFDETCLTNSDLNILYFDKPSAEWARFIVKNRQSRRTGFVHNYDIVYGPVANDGVYDQLRRYMQGRITAEELAEELTYQKLNNQYFFGTEKSLQFLKRV